MSELVNEDGTPIQAEAPVEAPVEFFFSLQADATGITELKFAKQVQPLFGVLLTTLDYINQTFDQPYPKLGDFLRSLADTADAVDAAYASPNQSQGAANDAAVATEEVPAS